MEQEQEQESIQGLTKIATFDLTPDQYLFLQSLLTRGFSLQEIRKPAKYSKKDLDSKFGDDGTSATQLLPRSSRILQSPNVEMYDTQMKTKRSRSKKIDDYPQEDVPKRKIKQPSIRTSGNPAEDRFQEQEAAQCFSILAQLKKNPNAKPFLEAVNPVQLGIPDYFEVVTFPMDLSTIQKKLRSRAYSTFKQFREDLTLIWLNSYKYNQKGSDIYYMTTEMDKFASKLYSAKANQSSINPYTLPSQVVAKKPSPPRTAVPKPPKKPKVVAATKINHDKTSMMTIVEKRKLCEDIKSLPKQHLTGVWEIVSESNDHPDLTFDIEKLPSRQLWQLEAYVRQRKASLENHPQQQVLTNEPKSQESSFQMESHSGK